MSVHLPIATTPPDAGSGDPAYNVTRHAQVGRVPSRGDPARSLPTAAAGFKQIQFNARTDDTL